MKKTELFKQVLICKLNYTVAKTRKSFVRWHKRKDTKYSFSTSHTGSYTCYVNYKVDNEPYFAQRYFTPTEISDIVNSITSFVITID